MRWDGHTFTILVNGLLDRVSRDHAARAPTPAEQPDSYSVLSGPQETVVPTDYENVDTATDYGDVGSEFVWEKFVGHEVDSNGNLWHWFDGGAMLMRRIRENLGTSSTGVRSSYTANVTTFLPR